MGENENRRTPTGREGAGEGGDPTAVEGAHNGRPQGTTNHHPRADDFQVVTELSEWLRIAAAREGKEVNAFAKERWANATQLEAAAAAGKTSAEPHTQLLLDLVRARTLLPKQPREAIKGYTRAFAAFIEQYLDPLNLLFLD